VKVTLSVVLERLRLQAHTDSVFPKPGISLIQSDASSHSKINV